MRMADISDSKIRESEGEHSPYPTAKRKRTIFLSLRWNYFLPQSLLCWLASWGCTMKDITGRKVSPFPQFLCPPPLPQQAVQPQNFHWDDGSCFMVFCTIFWVCSWFVPPPPPKLIFPETIRRRFLGTPNTKQRRQPVPPTTIVFSSMPSVPQTQMALSSSLLFHKGIGTRKRNSGENWWEAADC